MQYRTSEAKPWIDLDELRETRAVVRFLESKGVGRTETGIRDWLAAATAADMLALSKAAWKGRIRVLGQSQDDDT